MPKKKTKEEFILKCKEMHNDRYDYSMVEYNGSSSKVKIICKQHGVFEQLSNNHIRGSHCPKCSLNIKSDSGSMGLDKFISNSIKIHGDIYDYSLVDYKNNKTKVKIICKSHGVFEQKPNCHLSGRKCFKCFGKIKKTSDDFISDSIRIHGYKYDYSKVNYLSTDRKVIICCSTHGDFLQIPQSHINGSGCYKCKPNYKQTKDNFILKSISYHGDRYDYSKVDYINSHTKVEIVCEKHGSFFQAPFKHLQKRGCPSCRLSKGILKIINYLEGSDIKYKLEVPIENCLSINERLLKFDIYLTDYDCYIEYDGEQHFRPVKNWGGESSFIELKKRDIIKDNFCKLNNIKLFRISYLDNIEDKLNELLFTIVI